MIPGCVLSVFVSTRPKVKRGGPIFDMVAAGDLSLSSGAIKGKTRLIPLSDGKSAYYDQWHITEASFTPTPAEPWLKVNPVFGLRENSLAEQRTTVKSHEVISVDEWLKRQLKLRHEYIESLKQKMKGSAMQLPDPAHFLSNTYTI